MHIPKLWSDGWNYNEIVKDLPDRWKYNSRRNDYIFFKDNTQRYLSDIIVEYSAKSILDYGCGNSRAIDIVLREHSMHNVILAKYDPFVEGVDTRPEGQYDIVVCHNVLGGIDKEYIDAIIQDLLDYSMKIVIIKMPFKRNNMEFFSEAIKRAKGKLIKEFSVFEILGEMYMYFLLEKQNEEYES